MAASLLLTIRVTNKGVPRLLKLVCLMLDLEALILLEGFVTQAGEHLKDTVAKVAVAQRVIHISQLQEEARLCKSTCTKKS